MAKTLKGNGFVDIGYIPDMALFELDFNAVFKDIMPNIYNNPNIPQEIKDGWTEIYVINNIDKLYES